MLTFARRIAPTITARDLSKLCKQPAAVLQCSAIHGSKVVSQQADSDEVERRPDPAVASNMKDLGTRSIFSEEHDIYRRSVRHFMETEVVPRHSEWEERGYVDKEVGINTFCSWALAQLWLSAGKQGLLGANTPAEKGGLGADWLSATIVLEELMYVNCTGPGFPLHSDIIMPYVCKYGSPEQIERYIPDMTAGKIIGAIAMTEPGAGSDLQGIRANARRDGDDWILNGSKVFITNGYLCDMVIVVAITNTEAKSLAHGISLFIVDEGTPGFTKGKPLKKLGYKAQDTCELFFEDVRLPSSAVLGKENQGFYYLMNELPQERLLISNLSVAHSEFMFEETRQYVKERKAFGKTLANLQTIQHTLAEIKTKIAVTRTYMDEMTKQHNDEGLDSQRASMAKYWTTKIENEIATDCLQLFGGWGYMSEYPISKAFADARLHPIFGGTNEIMKELIARNILMDK